MQQRNDLQEYEKEMFGRHVAEMINEEAARKAFGRMILVAPPNALGVLRDAVCERTAKRVVAEPHKDLVRTPNKQLASHMREVVGLSKTKAPA